MENTVKQRITQYLTRSNISKSEFGRRIGVSSAFVSSMRKSIQPDKVKSIALTFPDLNIEWLLTGEGEMLLVETDKSQPTSSGSIKYYPNVEATMGDVQFLEDPNESYDLISIPNKFNGCVAINAFGDSMSPRILSGNIIFIQKWEERYIEWGKIYLVRTRHGNRMIKYLMPCDNDEDCVLACSENKKYPPVKIYNEDIIYPLYILRGGVWDMD